MRIWETAVNNRVAVYILILIIVLVGAQSYLSMPREAAPDITIPIVVVSVPYVGVSPADMEGLVTQPLESELKTLKDVKEITSSSSEGIASISVEFNTGVDIDEALRRVRDKVNTARPDLPEDILEPIISEINFSEFPIMFVNYEGPVGPARLKEYAEVLQDKIEAIPGVLSAEITGGLTHEVQINCDINRLKGYDVSFNDIIGSIASENLTIPGGSINNGRTEFTVRVPGEFENPKPIEDIVVKMRNGQPIYIRDVADVDYSYEDRDTYSRLNLDPVVTLTVKKRAGENLIRIADQVNELVAQEAEVLPAGVGISISGDQSEEIRRSVHELENSVMTGMFLVVLVLFAFFGVKNALLISTAIPLSMLIGIVVLAIMGVTLNFVVLFALVLVLGIVVDDAVVVIENIYRHQQEYGKGLIEAAKDGTKEVAVPVATATFTTVAAFLPLLFWPGIVGEFMYYLPVTVLATMLSSLFVGLIISPVQGSVFINYHKEREAAKKAVENPSFWQKYNPITRIFHFVDEKFFPYAQKKYVGTLRWTLANKGKTLLFAGATFVGVFVLFGIFNKGVEFFPSTQPRYITVSVEMPVGTPIEVTNEATRIVEQRIAKIEAKDDIEHIVTNVGQSSDPFDFSGSKPANKSSISVNMYKKAEREYNSFETLEVIRDVARGVPGAQITVEKQQEGPPVGMPVTIELAGDDYTVLRSLSNQIQESIKDVPGLVDLKDDYNAGKPEIQVVVDREKAALLEMSTGQIANEVRSAINGTEASQYRVGEDEYKIMVRLKEEQRTSIRDLENLNITFMNKKGRQISIPLVSVANIVRSTGLTNIRHKDQKRVITITADAQGRLGNEVLADVQTQLTGFDLPDGYEFTFAGESEEQDKAAAFLSQALVITLLLVFLVLVSEFNSIKVPTVIMVSVFLSFIGVFIGLLVTQTPFGVIMTGVGVVSLAGIVVKNAIVLLDFVKQMREQGMTLDEALLEAGRTRLRPVVLTAVSTILGVAPLATGVDFDWRSFEPVIGAESSDFWRPLGITIIFGLAFSTFLTLVIVPTYYSYAEEKTEKFVAWFKRKFRRGDAKVAAAEAN